MSFKFLINKRGLRLTNFLMFIVSCKKICYGYEKYLGYFSNKKNKNESFH